MHARIVDSIVRWQRLKVFDAAGKRAYQTEARALMIGNHNHQRFTVRIGKVATDGNCIIEFYDLIDDAVRIHGM